MILNSFVHSTRVTSCHPLSGHGTSQDARIVILIKTLEVKFYIANTTICMYSSTLRTRSFMRLLNVINIQTKSKQSSKRDFKYGGRSRLIYKLWRKMIMKGIRARTKSKS